MSPFFAKTENFIPSNPSSEDVSVNFGLSPFNLCSTVSRQQDTCRPLTFRMELSMLGISPPSAVTDGSHS
jgi:hypothetical protein